MMNAAVINTAVMNTAGMNTVAIHAAVMIDAYGYCYNGYCLNEYCCDLIFAAASQLHYQHRTLPNCKVCAPFVAAAVGYLIKFILPGAVVIFFVVVDCRSAAGALPRNRRRAV